MRIFRYFFDFQAFYDVLCDFLILYGITEAREAFKNLPEARGFVVIECEPVASHGDPIRAQNCRFVCALGA